tara:strand:+ start:401 stop:601 length:201 start_codon:yes stop_codon:yes gene_type:complete
MRGARRPRLLREKVPAPTFFAEEEREEEEETSSTLTHSILEEEEPKDLEGLFLNTNTTALKDEEHY